MSLLLFFFSGAVAARAAERTEDVSGVTWPMFASMEMWKVIFLFLNLIKTILTPGEILSQAFARDHSAKEMVFFLTQ